jgi:hypothetical protein
MIILTQPQGYADICSILPLAGKEGATDITLMPAPGKILLAGIADYAFRSGLTLL